MKNASPSPRPAAQYLRMSTDHQHYSLRNQANAIAGYANEHGFDVIATYQDEGKSGLTIKGRDGLKSLLADVLSGSAPYKDILVRDVSRWGRFQNPDQAAHYEFLCREAGVTVHYCIEAFINDGSTMSGIVKHLKRIMAAEFSRELSLRLKAAFRLQVSMGNVQGGPAPYGTRRQAFSLSGQPRSILEDGRRKERASDVVKMVRGPTEEVAVIRRIFEMFVRDLLSASEIARRLNAAGTPPPTGQRWQSYQVLAIVRSETVLGFSVYNKSKGEVGQARTIRPPDEWRRIKVMPPVIAERTFKAAAARQISRRFHRSDDELLSGLRRVLAEHGRISAGLINAAPYLPTFNVFKRRFGSIHEAYRRIGYYLAGSQLQVQVWQKATDGAVIRALAGTFERNGHLTARMIERDPTVPGVACLIDRFGSLRHAYALAGYTEDVYAGAWARRRAREAASALT